VHYRCQGCIFSVHTRNEIISYNQSAYIRKLIPDLVLTNKGTGDVAVFDAKYKTLRLNKEDYRERDSLMMPLLRYLMTNFITKWQKQLVEM
jgi:5-methylcytosine-specific restriction endonuclease McrBC regulatory subunit McrC